MVTIVGEQSLVNSIPWVSNIKLYKVLIQFYTVVFIYTSGLYFYQSWSRLKGASQYAYLGSRHALKYSQILD
jgi:hypothetical protein